MRAESAAAARAAPSGPAAIGKRCAAGSAPGAGTPAGPAQRTRPGVAAASAPASIGGRALDGGEPRARERERGGRGRARAGRRGEPDLEPRAERGPVGEERRHLRHLGAPARDREALVRRALREDRPGGGAGRGVLGRGRPGIDEEERERAIDGALRRRGGADAGAAGREAAREIGGLGGAVVEAEPHADLAAAAAGLDRAGDVLGRDAPAVVVVAPAGEAERGAEGEEGRGGGDGGEPRGRDPVRDGHGHQKSTQAPLSQVRFGPHCGVPTLVARGTIGSVQQASPRPPQGAHSSPRPAKGRQAV
jgi:hypothetical protein